MLQINKLYKGGIIMDSKECREIIPNHSAEAIGFGEENGTKYWILKNSWGHE